MNIYLDTGFWPIFLYPEGINIIYQSISISVHLRVVIMVVVLVVCLPICERNKYLAILRRTHLSKAGFCLEVIISISVQSGSVK